MTMRRLVLGCVGILGALATASCSSLPEACRGDACGAAATPDGGDGGTATPPPGCDPLADPREAPRCVVNDYGVFVDAASGLDANPGTRESPVKSIAAALARAGARPRVYVCDGTYPERVALTTPTSLFGGFACGSWTPSGNKAAVAPTEPGYALRVDKLSAPVVVADMTFTARDAAAPGASSVAVFVASASLTLRRVDVAAGKANDGQDATPLADLAPATAPQGAAGAAGGAQTPNPLCPSSVGGAAGKDGAPNGAPGLVAIAPPFPDASFSGAGGSAVLADCNGGSSGRNGSFGAGGAPGAGAATWGTLTADGWKGRDGAAGGDGGHGQGGGGGAQRFAGGTGGGGGPGGCGGKGGAPGTAGGSSIAVLAFQADLALFDVSLVASNAGRGGNAANGQKAQAASSVQALGTGSDACVGGYGGHGGAGGGGGGGAGGLSVGILYKGRPPSLDGTPTPTADALPRVSLGTMGAPGLKGLGAGPLPTNPASRKGQDGVDGLPGHLEAILSVE
jgi:hypothetical protein